MFFTIAWGPITNLSLVEISNTTPVYLTRKLKDLEDQGGSKDLGSQHPPLGCGEGAANGQPSQVRNCFIEVSPTTPNWVSDA